jgi:hypothetical protein
MNLDKIKRYIQNLPGKSTNRKLLVIESDDWGSIRMPNKKVYTELQDLGYKPENDPYLKFDALASEDDLNALFEVLNSVRDSQGNPAKITANAVVANPNFTKIRENLFEDYVYEPFTDTLKKYPEHAKSFDLWKEGMSNNLFKPQYHGREHINVHQWMKSLKSGDRNLLKAFDFEMISISSLDTGMKFDYMEGLDYFSVAERDEKEEILTEGMGLFEDLLGYKSISFIANCYIWDRHTETVLSNLGVKYLQGVSNQCIPKLDKNNNHKIIYKKHYFGEKNKLGQRYFFRNAFFEPSLSPTKDWVSDCLERIDIAFKCKKPAIIGSHRLNYIGFIDQQNRTQNLFQFKILLKKIVEKWPTIEFISTDELDSLFH